MWQEFLQTLQPGNTQSSHQDSPVLCRSNKRQSSQEFICHLGYWLKLKWSSTISDHRMVMFFDDHMYKAYWQKWKNFREIQGKNQRGRSDVNTAYSVRFMLESWLEFFPNYWLSIIYFIKVLIKYWKSILILYHKDFILYLPFNFLMMIKAEFFDLWLLFWRQLVPFKISILLSKT